MTAAEKKKNKKEEIAEKKNKSTLNNWVAHHVTLQCRPDLKPKLVNLLAVPRRSWWVHFTDVIRKCCLGNKKSLFNVDGLSAMLYLNVNYFYIFI